ncbi:phage protein [Psychrobacillus lasiicapitis]|uniref:Uncharacterized protein n=1 Tax=Psychrobacillus lasiicapitis TaxID=1636719 RepID=A0A544TAJ1_9BACI|nr:hypothetical protein [Psychrobacillus lasiicapitis]TQR14473.1 hypothetical protein FG382_08435 [Psychrobacillus lasiicapitis]GGA31038.1 hypothetical protein GCM10011384_20670 [Psychrobacillus lasiicapitis]
MSTIQFGRVTEIITNDLKISSDTLEIEFNIPFDDDPDPNVSEIVVYNLSDTTLSKLKKGVKLTMNAGYKADKGVILSGFISTVASEKGGADRATKISVVDSQPIDNKKTLKKTFKKGIKGDQILKELAKAIKLKIAVIKLPNNVVYKKGFSVNGPVVDAMKKIAKDCGASFYISRSNVYIRSIKEGDNTQFILNSNTGLIGSPEYFEEERDGKVLKGYRVKSLLQYRMNTASIIELQSLFVKGKFRVRKGKHYRKGDVYYSEVEVIA